MKKAKKHVESGMENICRAFCINWQSEKKGSAEEGRMT